MATARQFLMIGRCRSPKPEQVFKTANRLEKITNEVPRIAQQFGLDSSVRVNMMSVVHATTTAVNLSRSVARASGK